MPIQQINRLNQAQQSPSSRAFGGANPNQSQPPGGFGRMQFGNSSGSGVPGSFSVGGNNQNRAASANNNNSNPQNNPSSSGSNPFSAASQGGGFSGSPGQLNEDGTPMWDASMELTPGFNAANPGSFAGINGSGDDKFAEAMEDKLDKLTENREEAEQKAKEEQEKAQNGDQQ